MDNIPYFLFGKIGPWDEEIKNPYTNDKKEFNEFFNSNFKENSNKSKEKTKLPSLIKKTILENFEKSKKPKKCNLEINNNIEPKQKLEKKLKENKTIHVRESYFTTKINEKNKEIKKSQSFLKIETNSKLENLKDLKTNSLFTSQSIFANKEIPFICIDSYKPLQKYYEGLIKTKIKGNINFPSQNKQKLESERSHSSQSTQEKFYLEGKIINCERKKSKTIRTEKIKTIIKLENKEIKNKMDRLKKIDKKPIHFLQYFLTKYDEDLNKKKKLVQKFFFPA